MAAGKKLEKIIKSLQHMKVVFPLFIFTVSFCFFFAHSHTDLNFRTYISENALSPGVVENEFRGNEDLYIYYAKLHNILKHGDNQKLQSWLMEELEFIGLDVGQQNFTLNYPELFGAKSVQGRNVYGILRAPGIAQTEAVVLTSWIGSGTGKENESNFGAMALLLALAKSFRLRLYWAKDIIFLFTDMQYLGLQAWLDNYHGAETPRIIGEDLKVRSGSIQAALNFEIPNDRFRYMNLKIEGVNGILPNLDLINTVKIIGESNNLHLRLHDVRTHPYPSSSTGLRSAALCLTRMMLTQASGSPNGQHGLFLPFQVPAVTLSAGASAEKSNYLLVSTARVVEGVMRSLNNLQERFHQSFFFYLLPRIDRYFSIGIYMLPFGGILVAMLLQVILLWLEVSSDHETLPTALWWQLMPLLVSCLVFGLTAFTGSAYFLSTSRLFSVSPTNGLIGGLFALSFSALFFPWMLRRKTERPLLFDWRFYKCAILLAQALLIGCIGVLNISMATFLSIGLVPMALIARPVANKFGRLLMILLLFTVHPMSIVLIGSAADLHFRGNAVTFTTLSNSFRKAVLQSFVEQEFLGSWTFRIATTAVFPIWLMFWGLIMS